MHGSFPQRPDVFDTLPADFNGRHKMSKFFNRAGKRELFRLVAQNAAKAMMILILGSLAAQGAWAQKITMEFDQAADFSKYKTFNIRDGQLNSGNPALNSPLVKKQIEADIERYLTAKGLTQVTGPSDLNVRYTFGSARKVEIESYPAGWYGMGTRNVRVPYAEGTLVIDLRDPATRSLVWRSIASQENTDATKIQGKLDDMVKKSIDKYPPKKK
jgi:hypothetical protein